MTDPERESVVMLFVTLGILLKLCGVLHFFLWAPEWIPVFQYGSCLTAFGVLMEIVQNKMVGTNLILEDLPFGIVISNQTTVD